MSMMIKTLYSLLKMKNNKVIIIIEMVTMVMAVMVMVAMVMEIKVLNILVKVVKVVKFNRIIMNKTIQILQILYHQIIRMNKVKLLNL